MFNPFHFVCVCVCLAQWLTDCPFHYFCLSVSLCLCKYSHCSAVVFGHHDSSQFLFATTDRHLYVWDLLTCSGTMSCQLLLPPLSVVLYSDMEQDNFCICSGLRPTFQCDCCILLQFFWRWPINLWARLKVPWLCHCDLIQHSALDWP